MKVQDIISQHLTLENFRAEKASWAFEELVSRFPDEAVKAADLAEATGRSMVDCLPDPYMALGLLSSEFPEGADELIARLVPDDNGFAAIALFMSPVPQGYQRMLDLLEERGLTLKDGGRVWDWSGVLCESLTGQRGLPIEALLELEDTLGSSGELPRMYEELPLLETYASYVLGRSTAQIREANLVASLLPPRPVRVKVDQDAYPVLHAALTLRPARIRQRDHVDLPNFTDHADEYESTLRPYTLSPSWPMMAFLAHKLDDPWKLIGQRRENMTPGTLEFLRSSGGMKAVRCAVAMANEDLPQVARWGGWLYPRDIPRLALWTCYPASGVDVLAASTVWTLLQMDEMEGRWAEKEGSCVRGLNRSDIDEIITRGYTAEQAATLLSTLRSAEAFRLHFYEGIPVEYAMAMVDWDDG